MGQQQSQKLTAEAQHSKTIDARLAREQTEAQLINRILLVGPSSGGRVTTLRQAMALYGRGTPAAVRAAAVPTVRGRIRNAATILLAQSVRLGLLPEDDKKTFAFVDELKDDATPLSDDSVEALKRFWADRRIQGAYEKRIEFLLPEHTSFFFERIDEIARADYVPTELDMAKVKPRTCGIVENELTIDGNQFVLLDTSGQRNERKKWIHCFERVAGLLFIASATEYDQTLYEDEKINKMREAINLFEETVNSRWFSQAHVFLLLTKRDLFAEKIQKVPLTVCFPDYTGGSDYEEASDYLKQQFLRTNHHTDRTVHCHLVCATDTDNVAAVWNSIKDVIIRAQLRETGLL